MNLYEIDRAMLDCVNEDGEIIDLAKFHELSMSRNDKIQNIAKWIKNLASDAEALKNEKESFAHRQKVVENKLEALKQYLSDYLGGQKFITSEVAVTFKKSEVLDVSDTAIVPGEYLRIKTEVDKNSLKKAIKSGLVLDGVQIIEKVNVQVK